MRFPFVTTAHWVFDTGGILKYVTNWGEKTVAVSEDIKQYLMDNYHVPEKDIFVTVNGIDTDKFSPDISGERICRSSAWTVPPPSCPMSAGWTRAGLWWRGS